LIHEEGTAQMEITQRRRTLHLADQILFKRTMREAGACHSTPPFFMAASPI
jgi:glutamine synthetase